MAYFDDLLDHISYLNRETIHWAILCSCVYEIHIVSDIYILHIPNIDKSSARMRHQFFA